MRRRAEQQEETRQRIVSATVALHQEAGLLGTTVSDIAARAGVERATVYRHFPDDRSLITACTAHYFRQHPIPDDALWWDIDEPVERLRVALNEIYAYHRRTEPMMSRTLPEVTRLPVAQEAIAPIVAQWNRMADDLASGWRVDAARQGMITAAIGHAIAFPTWQSLACQQRLDDARAVELMVAMVRCAARDDAGTMPTGG